MPVIIFEGSKMDQDKKKDLIRKLTDASAEVTGIDPQSFVVYIHENDMDSIGVGGLLLTEHLAKNR